MTQQKQIVGQSPIDALVALAKGMWVTLKHMGRKRDTVQFPFERKEPPRRMHGRHLLNRYDNGLEKCIGCELCAGACPADAILVWGAENDPDNPVSVGERYAAVYEINMLRCIFCGLCVEACPTDAITMTTFFEFTSNSRSSMVYSKEELLTPPPSVEWAKFGYVGDPIVLPQSEMEQPGVGALHPLREGHPHTPGAGEPDTEHVIDVPVVWLPQEKWRDPYAIGTTLSEATLMGQPGPSEPEAVEGSVVPASTRREPPPPKGNGASPEGPRE